MKLACWNVNSIRSRLDRLTAWLTTHQPDVLCLQELKSAEDTFPGEALAALGYHWAGAYQKTYNGVAILSRTPLEDVRVGLDDGVDDPQARLISAVVNGVRIINVYCPNGSEVGSDKWDYKLAWLGRLRRYLDTHHNPAEPLALCGDFNVAPDERDVHDPAVWANEVIFHPLARQALQNVVSFGLKDSLRLHTQEGGIYSWWDYRNLGFPKNHGIRIDLILLTPPLAGRCTSALVDRQERKGKLPSDHAPVLATFAPAP